MGLVLSRIARVVLGGAVLFDGEIFKFLERVVVVVLVLFGGAVLVDGIFLELPLRVVVVVVFLFLEGADGVPNAVLVDGIFLLLRDGVPDAVLVDGIFLLLRATVPNAVLVVVVREPVTKGLRPVDSQKSVLIIRIELAKLDVAEVVVLAGEVPARAVDRTPRSVARDAPVEDAARGRARGAPLRSAPRDVARRRVRAGAQSRDRLRWKRRWTRRAAEHARRDGLDPHDFDLLRVPEAPLGLARLARPPRAARVVALLLPRVVVVPGVLHLRRVDAHRHLDERAVARSVPVGAARELERLLSVGSEVDAAAQGAPLRRREPPPFDVPRLLERRPVEEADRLLDATAGEREGSHARVGEHIRGAP